MVDLARGSKEKTWILNNMIDEYNHLPLASGICYKMQKSARKIVYFRAEFSRKLKIPLGLFVFD